MFQKFVDYREKRKLVKRMRAIIYEVCNEEYCNFQEATRKIINLTGLIEESRLFNERTLTKPINTLLFLGHVKRLEQKVENDSYQTHSFGVS
jgi:hypothetical protein